jgi:CRP-like cAMP-binding protein
MNMAGLDVQQLSRLHPLNSLGPESLKELLPICQLDKFARNADPFHATDWTGRIVYLLRGQLKVEQEEGSERVLVGGHEQSNAPLLRGSAGQRSAKAITDVDIVSIPEDPLDIVLTWDQLATSNEHASDSAEQTDWRMMSGMFAVTNLTDGVFSSMPPEHIHALLQRFQRMPAKRGETVIRQGDPGDFYYLIESGRCKVSRLVAGTAVQLAELKEGDAFGEEALVADAARNATVTMKTDGALLRLAKSDFVELLRAPLLQKLTFSEADQRVAAGAIWIDVRFPAEYQYDGYPGAINIPLNDIRQAASSLDPAKAYIVYCQTGRRSSAAAFLLSQRGVHAALLAGGMKARAGAMESVE